MGEAGMIAVAVVVLALVGGAIYLGIRARQSSKAIVERDQLRDKQEERADALDDLRDTRRKLRGAWRRVRDRQGSGDPPA